MVGIVVVSHSLALAQAAVALAEEMLQGRHVPIVVAAGLDENTFGTDAVAIDQALLDADEDGDGVVVLMDLGSAVLSAELALDLLEDDDLRQRVLLCPGPLVEGLVAAAVTALSGAGRAEVAAEALNSLAGKQSQLMPAAEIDRAGPADSGDGTAEVTRLVVTAEHGLHARPAAKLVRLLQDADAQVELRNLSTGSAWVPATSLSRLATLGALNGHEIEARARGPRAREALKELSALAARNFDDPGSSVQPDLAPDRAGPLPASPGIGIGPALVLAGIDDSLLDSGQSRAADEQDERRSLDTAIATVRTQIEQVRGRVAREVGKAEAAIFDAFLALLADPEIVDGTHARIGQGQSAARAWTEAIGQVEAEFSALPDPYLRARAADVRAVGHQVLAELAGGTKVLDGISDSDRGVLVAADLTPA
jgi:dihydroxyacetone kinase phosphotransfer subunit